MASKSALMICFLKKKSDIDVFMVLHTNIYTSVVSNTAAALELIRGSLWPYLCGSNRLFDRVCEVCMLQTGRCEQTAQMW